MRVRAGHLRRTVLAGVIAALIVGPGACDGNRSDPGDAGAGPISRSVFVSTYVDLRLAALRHPDREITREERARVLREHGVTEEQLLGFVDAHYRDAEYMEGVWDEVEGRLDSLRTAGDTASS